MSKLLKDGQKMALKPGAKLKGGLYTVDSLLGVGDFCYTYRVRKEGDNLFRVVKEHFLYDRCVRNNENNGILLSKIDNDLYIKYLQRFYNEAKICMSLNHPNLAHIEDLFQENGTAYYVMNYVYGESLTQKVQRVGKLPFDEAYYYLCNVGEALSVLHDGSLCHRAVTPDNIIVTANSKPILVDYGMPREFFNDQGHRKPSWTPGFSAIEQYIGQPPMGPSTDIFGLTSVFYYCISGQVPPDATGRGSAPLRSLTEYNPQVPAKIDARILKGMELYPVSRPRNFLELMAGLPMATKPVISQQPVPVVEPVATEAPNPGKVEEDRRHQEEERKRREEEERRRREEEELRRREEEELRRREEEERRRREEEERRRREEEERKRREEEERKRREEEERKRREEEERRRREEEERRRREAEERRRREEEERRRREEEERRRREEEERRRREEEERKHREEEERRRREEEAMKQKQLEEQAWNYAVGRNDIDIFKAFLIKFPNSIRKVDANSKIAQLLAEKEIELWEVCSDNASLSTLKQYKKEFPSGAHISEVKKLIAKKNKKKMLVVALIIAVLVVLAAVVYIVMPTESKEWDKASGLNTYEAYEKYLEAYGGDASPEAVAHRNEAFQAMFECAGNDIVLLKKLVKNYPDSKMEEKVFVKSAELACDSLAICVEKITNMNVDFGFMIEMMNDYYKATHSSLEGSSFAVPDSLKTRILEVSNKASEAVKIQLNSNLNAAMIADGDLLKFALENASALIEYEGLEETVRTEAQNKLNRLKK